MVRRQGDPMNEELTIGLLATAACVNVETIRYYQRRGMLGEPDKPPGGHRRYAASTVSRIRFIKRAQQLGFTLEEVINLLRLEDGQSCRQQPNRMLAVIAGKSNELIKDSLPLHRRAATASLTDRLSELLARCHASLEKARVA